LLVTPTAIAFIVFLTFSVSTAAAAKCVPTVAKTDVPTGAIELGFSQTLFSAKPRASDIEPGEAPSKFYNGRWYDRSPPPTTAYSDTSAGLDLALGGAVATESRRSAVGLLPLIDASKGFYIEFSACLSTNNPDHFPALWLMPQAHDARQTDHDPGTPKYERWVEFDVDEGGFTAGHHGAVIQWAGVWPDYHRRVLANDSDPVLDRTILHRFGLSYDPRGQRVTWWIDNKSQGSVLVRSFARDIARWPYYYVIVEDKSHAKNTPYDLYLSEVSVFVR
jgi:hypothetical protein